MKITVLAIGKLRGPEAEACAEYVKRLTGDVTVTEMSASKSLPPTETKNAEAKLLLEAVPPKSFVVLLDERGKDLSSRELAAALIWVSASVSRLRSENLCPRCVSS